MSRAEARIQVNIWGDEDYTALPMDAQWLYEALLSQKSLNHAGVLTIPRREWSNLCADDDAADRIARARKVLEDRRYIVADDDTDELLVRSYIRHDVESGPPGIFLAAMNAATAVASSRLKAALYAELRRLDTAVVEKKRARGGERPIDALNRALRTLSPEPDDPSGKPADEEDAADAEPSHDHGMTDGMTDGMDMPSASHEHATSHGIETHGMTDGIPHAPGEGAGEGDRGSSCSVDPPDPKKAAAARAHARPGTLEHLNANATKVGGTTLVIRWRDDRGVKPTITTTRELAKEVDALLADGADQALMPAALDDWLARGKSVKFLRWCYEDQVKAAFATRRGRDGPALRAVSGGHVPYQDPADLSEYDESL